MIFKRKSFHIFRDIGNINPDELQSIEEKYNNLTPLINSIQTAIRIVPADQTTCKRGQEYCILLYSEKKRIIICKISVISVNSLTYILLLLELVHCGSVSVNLMSQPITVLILS